MALVVNAASTSTPLAAALWHRDSKSFFFSRRPLSSVGRFQTPASRAASLSVASSLTLPTANIGDAGNIPISKETSIVLQDDDDDDDLQVMDSEFYRMGYVRHVRAYGVEFKEGNGGIGVYAAKDMQLLKTARVIMEIPVELMITVTKDLPWMFRPNIVPFGHPMFEVINSTDPKTDWDLRLACLLLMALDQEENFWQLYSDYLPGHDELGSLLLATEDEVSELHDEELERAIAYQKKRVVDFWKQNWTADSQLKLKRLARNADQFLWAVGVAWSRKFMMTMTLGAVIQDAHMLIPYADMMNHSFDPTCSMRWRKRDRMLEVVMNPRQTIKRGTEMTLDYATSMPNIDYMQYYGFSSPKNPYEKLNFSGSSRIHLESFLSAFSLAGTLEDLYYDGRGAEEADGFVDGSVIAAARTLPTWSDGDLPFLPSQEIDAARDLQHECQQMLARYPTTLEEDYKILELKAQRSQRWQAAVKYRVDQKRFIQRIVETLDLYMHRILF